MTRFVVRRLQLPEIPSKLLLKVLLLIGLIVAGNQLSQYVIENFRVEISSVDESVVHKVIVSSMMLYIVLMALPFVPGAEISLAAIMILGPKIAPLIFLCTVFSLSLSFLVGRFIPERTLIKFLDEIHLKRASRLLAEFEGLDYDSRLYRILERLPKNLAPRLFKHRYLAILVLINVPGNIVIGGGGGIAMSAGMSRLFKPSLFLLTISIAVLPVPLSMILFGDKLGDWPV